MNRISDMDKDRARIIAAALRGYEEELEWHTTSVKKLQTVIADLREQHEACLTPDDLKVRLVDIGGFSVRLLGCLKSDDNDTIGDVLVRHTDIKQLRKIRNYGRKCEEEIKAYLAQHNLSFRKKGENKSDFYERIERESK